MVISTWPDVDPSFSSTSHTEASCSKDVVFPVSSSERIYGFYLSSLLQIEPLSLWSLYWSVQSIFSICFEMMSSGALNFTYPNSVAAVSFIDAIGICLFIKWKLKYHFNSFVLVISFASRHLNEWTRSFSVF